jgi:hypothetical protein
MSNTATRDVSLDVDAKLAAFMATFRHDPYGFVMAAFPWGVKGKGLENKSGPEEWQKELLIAIGKHSTTNHSLMSLGIDPLTWRSAVASGHGVGKSALVAWVIIWIMATRPMARGVVTANTGNQLETKTWPELAKWHAMSLVRHWFTWTASSYHFSKLPEEERKNYMISALTVSQHNTEAFAGLHNEQSAVLVIFDEASGIEQPVWEVAEGAFTDGEGFHLSFGNPTRPTGGFYDCFDKNKDLMSFIKHVDSRDVSHTNKRTIAEQLKKWGEDSAEAFRRVYGKFPENTFDGYIPQHVWAEACERDLVIDLGEAVVLGVDVARFGDDETVITVRRGRDARTVPQFTYRGLDNVRVADRVAEIAETYKADIIVIESVGPGVGVIDILRDRNFKVIDVHPGSAASKSNVMGNKRMEMWDAMKEWLISGGCVRPDPELKDQVTSIRYLIERKTQRQLMEAKVDMKKRGLKSPDRADSLALTFAVRIPRKDRYAGAFSNRDTRAITEYDIFSR